MENEKIHPFARTLGPGPYRFLGLIQIKVSEGRGAAVIGDTHLNPERGVGTCAHCGTGIMDCYVVETGDKRRFAVGSDCINKAFIEWNGKVPTEFERQKRAAAAMKRDARKLAKRQAEAELVRNAIEERSFELRALPHPSPQMAGIGHTMLDYFEFCLKNHSCQNAVAHLKRMNGGLTREERAGLIFKTLNAKCNLGGCKNHSGHEFCNVDAAWTEAYRQADQECEKVTA